MDPNRRRPATLPFPATGNQFRGGRLTEPVDSCGRWHRYHQDDLRRPDRAPRNTATAPAMMRIRPTHIQNDSPVIELPLSAPMPWKKNTTPTSIASTPMTTQMRLITAPSFCAYPPTFPALQVLPFAGEPVSYTHLDVYKRQVGTGMQRPHAPPEYATRPTGTSGVTSIGRSERFSRQRRRAPTTIVLDGPIVNLRSNAQSRDRRSPDEVSLAHPSLQINTRTWDACATRQ